MEDTLTQDIVAFIQSGYASVQADRAAARAAEKLAQQNEDEYAAELRRRLRYRLVRLTCTTETVERIGQGEGKYIFRNDRIKHELFVITDVSMTNRHGFADGPTTPLVHAARPGTNGVRGLIRGSEIGFRLLNAQIEIIQSEE